MPRLPTARSRPRCRRLVDLDRTLGDTRHNGIGTELGTALPVWAAAQEVSGVVAIDTQLRYNWTASVAAALTPLKIPREKLWITSKIDPKVFFSNERTFLAWLHTSVLLAGSSIALSSFSNDTLPNRLYGVFTLSLAIAFICYAMYQCERIDKVSRPYQNTHFALATLISPFSGFFCVQ